MCSDYSFRPVFLQPVVVALSGNVLEYMLSLAYVVGGALLGSPAGAEFLAARDAANQASNHLDFRQCLHVLCSSPFKPPMRHHRGLCCTVLCLPGTSTHTPRPT